MTELINDILYNKVNLETIFMLCVIVIAIYGLTFFYLVNTYVRINDSLISKKLVKKIHNMNVVIDDLFLDKKYLDSINTSLSIVINYASNNYGKVDIVTIDFDKFHNTINIISSNRSTTYLLDGLITQAEIKYVEETLLKRIPKGK